METTTDSPLERFVQGLATRDFDAIEKSFAPNVQFRGLVPAGLRQADNARDARNYLQKWFGDASEFEMIGHTVEPVRGDREHISYLLHLTEDGTPYVCEQKVFVNAGDRGVIEKFDLVCSGFIPR